MRKKEICVSVKKKVDTQNRKKGNLRVSKNRMRTRKTGKKGDLRVGKKECGHAKQEKRKSACWGKRRQTRKMRKMEICVSGNARDGTRRIKREGAA